MSTIHVTSGALAEAARRILRPGITAHQAVILAYTELVGNPLDPWDFDDAAVLLRTERLFEDGLTVPEALAIARAELIRFSVPEDKRTR